MLCGLSVPTIQRMEASEVMIRGNVDSLMKLIAALERAGVELIVPGASSAPGGRGVRLREDANTVSQFRRNDLEVAGARRQA